MSDEAQDRAAIQAVVAGLAEAWGSYFAEDADFTAWFGLYLKGRDAIAASHGIPSADLRYGLQEYQSASRNRLSPTGRDDA
jgi:hypothetical protein